jgi:hypothetical protein
VVHHEGPEVRVHQEGSEVWVHHEGPEVWVHHEGPEVWVHNEEPEGWAHHEGPEVEGPSFNSIQFNRLFIDFRILETYMFKSGTAAFTRTYFTRHR